MNSILQICSNMKESKMGIESPHCCDKKVQRYINYLLLVLLLFFFSLELFLVVPNYSWPVIEASLPDEAMFIETAKFGAAQFEAGYGPVFWGLLSQLLLLFPQGINVAFARIAFIVFKYLAVFLIAFRSEAKGKFFAAAFLFSIVGSPGYLFFGKIISPEYLLLFLSTLSVSKFFQDNCSFGKDYLWSVCFGFLAVLTKLNALPLFLSILFFGLWFGYVKSRSSSIIQYHVLLRRLFIMFLLSSLVLTLIFINGQKSVVSNLGLAFSIMPPLKLDYEALKNAWSFDGTTWDQIKLGGIAVDFMPILVMSIFTLLVLFENNKEKRWQYLVVGVSALAMLFSTVFHQLGHTWYLFLPFFLLAILSQEILSTKRRFIQASALVFVLFFAILNIPRLKDRVSLKIANNESLKENLINSNLLIGIARNTVPCFKSANFDILVPIDSFEKGFDAARMALQKNVLGIWKLPDVLIINNNLPSKLGSPLLQYVVKEDIDKYNLSHTLNGLELYIKTGSSCF
jgi:hypothetical protein